MAAGGLVERMGNMKTHMSWGLAGLLVLLATAGGVRAETVDEIAELARRGLGEEVLVAAVERTKQGFTLTTDQIIQLKEAGVPQNVIAAMLKNKAGGAPADAPAPAQELTVAPAQEAPAAGTGTLNLENVDDKTWGYKLDADSRTIWLSPAGGADTVVRAHGGVSIAAPTGTYEVRYAGEGAGQSVTIREGKKALLLVSRVETAEYEGLYVSVFEGGERRGGGKLATLRETRRASAGDQPSAAAARYEYVPPKEERVTERVVERVVEPSTVIYRDVSPPVYVSPYYYGYPSYYGYGHCYPYNRVGFGYHNWGRRSGFSVGVGFGF